MEMSTVETRYLISEFLGAAKAVDISEKFESGVVKKKLTI